MLVKAKHYVAGVWKVALISLLALTLIAQPISQTVQAAPRVHGRPACPIAPC